MEPLPSKNQEYWDACLIRTWRNFGTTIDAFVMYHSITGLRVMESNLLRCPPVNTYYPKSMRAYVASYLPKISEWLNKCGPEHDKKLLDKLSKSTYTVLSSSCILPDPEKKQAYKEHAKAKAINELNLNSIVTRNKDTDWNTVGGSIRTRASK